MRELLEPPQTRVWFSPVSIIGVHEVLVTNPVPVLNAQLIVHWYCRSAVLVESTFHSWPPSLNVHQNLSASGAMFSCPCAASVCGPEEALSCAREPAIGGKAVQTATQATISLVMLSLPTTILQNTCVLFFHDQLSPIRANLHKIEPMLLMMLRACR